MKTKKEIVYKLELTKREFQSIKDCLYVFINDGLNESIKGTIGFSKLSSTQLDTISKINDSLESID